MIIFNTKALLVGIGTLIVLMFGLYFKWNDGLCFILAGLTGLFLSVKISNKEAGYAGMPTLFFIPTHVYAVLIIIMGIAGFWSDKKDATGKSTSDTRTELVETDLAIVDTASVSGIDSIAERIKLFVSLSLVRQLKPNDICYRVVEDPKENKVLVLVMFPKLDDLSKDAKKDFRQLIASTVSEIDFFNGKQVYIGIKDKYGLELTQTPKTKNISFMATTLDLLPFYGNSPAEK
jgi:hypothetical protein